MPEKNVSNGELKILERLDEMQAALDQITEDLAALREEIKDS
jgi:hypothetical protein